MTPQSPSAPPPPTNTDPGLIVGYQFDQHAKPIDTLTPPAGQGWSWTHLELDVGGTNKHLSTMGLPREILSVLIAPRTRPMTRIAANGILVVGRGLPADETAGPDETVSIRAWIQPDRLITVVQFRVMGAEPVIDEINNGWLPPSPIALFLKIITQMTAKMALSSQELIELLDQLNEDVIKEDTEVTTADLAPLRIRALVLSRYLLPLRLALHDLRAAEAHWLSDDDRITCGMLADRVTRLSEDMESANNRANVARDEIVSQQSERLNRRLYALTILTAIFLPISAVTGLLGMNVGGLPLTDNSGFMITMIGGVILVAAEIALLRWARWL